MNVTRGRVAVLALGLLVLAICAVHAPHGPALGADDHGQYLLHARALVTGRPYVDIGFIHTTFSTMVAPIAEPPGLPALVAAVFVLAGERVDLARIILFASFAAFGWLVWTRIRRDATPIKAALVTGWSLAALGRLHALDTMTADLPFCAALWLVFAVADAGTVTDGRRLAILAFAGVAAFSFRMAALPLLPAAAAALLLRDRDERGAYAVLGVAWTAAAAAVMFGLPAAQVLAGETLRSPAILWRDLLLNARAALDGVHGLALVDLGSRTANLMLDAVLLSVCLVGLTTFLRVQRRQFTWIVAGWYLVMITTLPTRAGRYLWPLYPLLALSFLEGAKWLAGRIRVSITHTATVGAVFATLVVLFGVAQDALRPPPPTYRTHPDLQTMRSALAREDGGARTLRVVVFTPRVMAWEDGYTTMAGFDAPTNEMLALLASTRITHVVVGDAGTFAPGTASIRALVRDHPRQFREIARTPTFSLHAFIPTD